MGVVVELSLPPQEFELGRVLRLESNATILLETMVPLGERSIPLFRTVDERESFEAAVQGHPAVTEIHVVNIHEEEMLYALDWEVSGGTFFAGLLGMDASILEATGTAQQWSVEVRFRTHEALSEFQAHCADADIPITINRIYNPTDPDAGPWYGLTTVQRETLSFAVQEGYYAITRDCSTKDIAGHFDISDQAVIERLRRGVTNLVFNTLLVSEPEDAEN